MSVLRVLGVELPIVAESLRPRYAPVGGGGRRNTAGWLVQDKRRQKRAFEFSLSPSPIDEAELYRLLITGEGEYWSMRTSQYGSKGLGVFGTGAWTGSGGGNPNFANGVWRADTNETLTVEGNLYNQAPVGTNFGGRTGSTLIGWRYDAMAATYRLFGFAWRAQDAAPTVKRECLGPLGSSGAPQNFTGTETFAVTSGGSPNSSSLLTITATSAGSWFGYSHLLLLPWYFPQAQVDQLLSGRARVGYAPPDLPRVLVTSDTFFASTQQVATGGEVSLVCNGEVEGGAFVQGAHNGVWTDLQTLDCVLTET